MLTVNLAELDFLRSSVREMYRKLGGKKILGNSTLKIYHNLAEYFKVKFQQDKIRLNAINDNGQEVEVPMPGAGFLRDLFYRVVKDNKSELQAHEYHFDICYLFVFGMLRDKYCHPDKFLTIDKSPVGRVIITSITAYGKEAEQIKKHIESNFPEYIVEQYFRNTRPDTSEFNLISLHNSQKENEIIFHLVGKSCFHNETYVSDVNDIRKNCPEMFLNSPIILMNDICSGAYDIGMPSGRDKLNDRWREDLTHVENVIARREKGLINSSMKAKRKIQDIIFEMEQLIVFIRSAPSTPFEHLINNYADEDWRKLLSYTSVSEPLAPHLLKMRDKVRKTVFSKQPETKKKQKKAS